MKSIETIIRNLRVAMTDARQNESHFESWMILNEAICDAIDALAEQPAQQQEPVGHVSSVQSGSPLMCNLTEWERKGLIALYTSPPAQRKPLTDEQIQEVVTKAVRERKLSWLGFKKDDQGEYTIPVLSSSDYQMARAIEAAHKIKGNT